MRQVVLVCIAGIVAASTSFAQSQVSPAPVGSRAATFGELRSYATLHSIGIEWNLQGDANHNAECDVRFRSKGADEWREALPLFRVDYAWYYHKSQAKEPKNMLAGSIMFLTPGREYEVRLDLTDPDGGKESKTLTARTRPLPQLPKSGRIFHVISGEGGGAGSDGNPFRGLAAAQAAARPGDLFLLGAGKYGSFRFDKGGEPLKYIAWKAAPRADVRFDRINVAAPHLWIEGVRVDAGVDDPGLRDVAGVEDVVLCRSSFYGFHYSITLHRKSRDWYIADNVIVGDKPLPTPGKRAPRATSGEGIELAQSLGGHTVCYNRISRVADGVSYPGHDCDVYGNDIFDVTDDTLEPDRGWANNRFWGNRLANFGAAAISFQPMYCGPWYFVRNQIVAGQYEDTEIRKPHIFKFRVQDRFALINNTIVFPRFIDVYMDCIFTSLSRNNVFISSTGAKPIWIAMRYKPRKPVTPETPRYTLPILKPDWRTDVDYNGYDWGGDSKDWRKPVFRYHWTDEVRKCYIGDLKTFSEVSGTEQHGMRVRKEEVFDKWNVPDGVGRVPPLVLALEKDGPALDAGAPLPNVTGRVTGQAPDLGAFEVGAPLMHFGPRDQETMKAHALYWAIF